MKTMMRRFFTGHLLGRDPWLNTAWLLFRMHIGLSMAVHAGWPKMNTLLAPGWFNDQVAGLGYTFPSPAFWATLASWGEFAGGICLALGLLTRFSALQLAFQFFVISFVWYNEPEPLTGMYFQQTLFWGYVLVTVGGGGRFSLDQWLFHRKKLVTVPLKPMMAVLLLGLSFSLSAQPQPSPNPAAPVFRLAAVDFEAASGDWKGALTYLDYTSHQLTSIPASARLRMDTAAGFDLSIYYAEEPGKNDRTTYRINPEGKQLNGMTLVDKRDSAGLLMLVLDEEGEDGNEHRPATLRRIWQLSDRQLILIKQIRWKGETEFFERHRYVFTRS